MKYYEVIFDHDYIKRDGSERKGTIEYEDIDNDEALKIVQEHLRNIVTTSCFREPKGLLRHKFLVPGGGYGSLWDWDSFFMACSLDDKYVEYAKGSAMDLIENIGGDGRPIKNATPKGDMDPNSTPLPLQAQFAYLTAKRLNDFSWVEQYWYSFERMIAWFDGHCMRNGMYVYRNLYGNGIDNNPAVYGRGDMSTSPCDFISFMYRELRTLQKLAKIFGNGREDYYCDKADKLKKIFQEKYFDEMDNSFYNIDVNTTDNVTLQAVNWVTYLKFRSWSNIFPLWAGLATKEQAKCMRDMIMSDKHYLSVCGVRSHAKSDPVYNNVPMGNPSNWQGPVWGLSTFLTAFALFRYGYKEDALEVAYRLIRTYALDIKQNGCIHEYYDGDNGQPLIRPDFTSWNLMAVNIIDSIKNGIDFTTFDLLD